MQLRSQDIGHRCHARWQKQCSLITLLFHGVTIPKSHNSAIYLRPQRDLQLARKRRGALNHPPAAEGERFASRQLPRRGSTAKG